jgi:hypothetical protein
MVGYDANALATGRGYFDLIPLPNKEVDMRSVPQTHAPSNDDPLYGYLCGYMSVGAQGVPPSVLIDKVPASPRFMFTGALQGCSIIVEDAGAQWRVTHDSRVNSSAHYPHRVAAIDFSDYTTGTMTRYVGANLEAVGVAVHEQVGAAAACLYWSARRNRWVLHCQKQEWNNPIITSTYGLTDWLFSTDKPTSGKFTQQQQSVRTAGHIEIVL